MQKIRPFLWFDGKAEEAANFYTTIFKGSNAGSGPKGSVMFASFEINAQEFIIVDPQSFGGCLVWSTSRHSQNKVHAIASCGVRILSLISH